MAESETEMHCPIKRRKTNASRNVEDVDTGASGSMTVPTETNSVGSSLSPIETNNDASSYKEFLSFRGPDTRHGFSDHLCNELLNAGIDAFRDDDELCQGENIRPKLMAAIMNIYKKHYPPTSDDEVWRLEKIAKNGKSLQKLSDAGIYKVEDFLLQLFTDSTKLKEEHGDAIIKKALDNWNDVREFNGETFSGPMQKKNSGCFPSQVFEGEIENLIPVQRNLAPQFCVTPVGLEAPLFSAICNAEGHNGAIALALPAQLQNTNSGNAMKFSVNESICLTAQQLISTDPLNVLIPQGDNDIPTVRLPIQPHGNNFQYAMRNHMIHSPSQIDYTVNENVPPSEPPSAAISIFQSSSTRPPPVGNHAMEDLQPTVSEDNLDYLLAYFSQSPPNDGGSVRGTSKGATGWLKIKAVIQWGFFIRNLVMKRRVRIVEPPIEVQAGFDSFLMLH